MKTASMLVSALLAFAMAACERAAEPETAAPPAPAQAPAAATMPATQPGEVPAEDATPDATAPATFVDKVWRVRESSAVAQGTRYSFLGDGTLVIEGEGGPPGHGRWTYEDGALAMTEEGMTYPVDILALDADRFEIRSHNPGEPVTIAFEAATDAPLPAAPTK